MPKKAKKHHSSREDRISVLPDHLLQHILSFLVLKEVIATSVLSKRWICLWTSVPTLDLGRWDHDSEYQLLSFLDTEVKLPPSKSTCLELNITMQKSDLIGMAHVLRSAHLLETLILDISSITMVCFQDRHLGDRDFGFLWESLGYSLSSIRSLKNVEIKNFLESESDQLYKDPGPNFNVNTFLASNWEKKIKLVKILLESCMMLQTMSISTIEIPSRIVESEVLLLALTKRLLPFPRASTNAEIYFS